MNDLTEEREARIRSFFPLVKKIARRIQRVIPNVDADDLVGDGCVGLIRAVDTFDPSRGPTFERYASRIVAGAMLNGLRRLDPVSERVRREMREAERERSRIAGETGVLPTQAEMEILRPGLRRAALHAYLYAPLSLDGPLPQGESLSADWSGDPAVLAVEKDERTGIRTALRRLPLRQQFVLTLHYFRGQSLHQIGRTMAISPQRASQLHIAALRGLQRVMSAAR